MLPKNKKEIPMDDSKCPKCDEMLVVWEEKDGMRMWIF